MSDDEIDLPDNSNFEFSEYEEYSKIEQHIFLSKSLYELDVKGKYIMDQIAKKKSTGTRRRSGNYIFTEDISTVFNNLIHCLSLKRLKLYFCMQYFLDELLYHEIKKTSTFFIEDNSYDISKLYFSQNEWISDAFIQKFEFYDTNDLNINEAMFLVCYLQEYDRFLLDVEEYIKSFKDIKHIKSKLRDTIHRIRFRHKNIWSILITIINQNISSD